MHVLGPAEDPVERDVLAVGGLGSSANSSTLASAEIYGPASNVFNVTANAGANEGYRYNGQAGYSGNLIGATSTSTTTGKDVYGNQYTSNSTSDYAIIDGEAKVTHTKTTTTNQNIDGSTSTTTSDMV